MDYMYIAKSTSKSASGKVYQSILLRESYREGSRVRNRTIANLTKCSPSDIHAIEMALKHKSTPQVFSENSFEITQGRSIGSIYALNAIAERLGISKALGNSFHAKLVLWQIFGRILEQGSRLAATRLNAIYDIASVINLKRGFDENDFYESLHWLAQNQSSIEDFLFNFSNHSEQFYWYDVTSSYFEGKNNVLAAYGHNRDKKKRKKQIVIGLLTINNGQPISVEAFPGNTQDTQTFQNQLEKLSKRFNCKNIIIIGDRGMIRNKQKLLTNEYDFNYITALTLPEINSLISKKHLSLTNFKKELQSVVIEGTRYIYRRNPGRAQETKRQRQERLDTAQKHVDKENERLRNQAKTSAFASKRRIKKYLKKLCIFEWASVSISKRQLILSVDEDRLALRAQYDGCYVWTTLLTEEQVTDQEIYDRYKDLKYVEEDFRTFKTDFLEIRPIYVRTEESTKGHLFITMLAHMIVRELREAWKGIDLTVQEGLRVLSQICHIYIKCSDNVTLNTVSKPGEVAANLLKALHLPSIDIKETIINVVTRHKTRSTSK